LFLDPSPEAFLSACAVYSFCLLCLPHTYPRTPIRGILFSLGGLIGLVFGFASLKDGEPPLKIFTRYLPWTCLISKITGILLHYLGPRAERRGVEEEEQDLIPDSKKAACNTLLVRSAGHKIQQTSSGFISPEGQCKTDCGLHRANQVATVAFAPDGKTPDSKDEDSQTPLSWAAGEGRETAVKLLLARDGVDPNSKDGLFGRTPLA
jgi:hypothetical protein